MQLKSRVVGSLVSALTLTFVLMTVSDAESDVDATTVIAVDAADEVTPTTVAAVAEARGHFKKMMMNPYMLIPQLISLGFAPIVLANLKMMVMSALMINNMALNAAIFMTIRNLVFGPRPTVKYNNYGYRDPPLNHDHQYTQYLHHDNGHHYPEQKGQQQLQPQPWTDEMATWDRQRKRKADVDS